MERAKKEQIAKSRINEPQMHRIVGLKMAQAQKGSSKGGWNIIGMKLWRQFRKVSVRDPLW